MAGLTLKGLIERSFISISEEAIEYFKANVLYCYLNCNITIRKTISNLINTFLRHAGSDSWPEILDFLNNSLNLNEAVEASLETINIILEDSGSSLEETNLDVNNFKLIYIVVFAKCF